MTAVWLRSSPQKFSSLPAITVTNVPSLTSPNATTLNATGSVLFERQWLGSVVQTCQWETHLWQNHSRKSIELRWQKKIFQSKKITMCGEPVLTNSPGCSANKLSMVRSAKFSAVINPLLLLLFLFVSLLLLLWLLLLLLADFVESIDDIWWFVVDDTSVAKCIFNFFFNLLRSLWFFLITIPFICFSFDLTLKLSTQLFF